MIRGGGDGSEGDVIAVGLGGPGSQLDFMINKQHSE
jgi:hypothetical protein